MPDSLGDPDSEAVRRGNSPNCCVIRASKPRFRFPPRRYCGTAHDWSIWRMARRIAGPEREEGDEFRGDREELYGRSDRLNAAGGPV